MHTELVKKNLLNPGPSQERSAIDLMLAIRSNVHIIYQVTKNRHVLHRIHGLKVRLR